MAKKQVTPEEFWRVVNERLQASSWCDEITVRPGPEGLVLSGPANVPANKRCIEIANSEVAQAHREFDIVG